MRIGKKFRKLAKNLPENEARTLWGKINPKIVYDGFAELHKLAATMKQRIDEKSFLIIAKAKQSGEKVRRTWGACGDPSCSICGGRQPNHFNLEWEGKGESSLNLEEFLAKYLPSEEVLGFVSLVRNYECLRILLYYSQILYQNTGLLEREGG